METRYRHRQAGGWTVATLGAVSLLAAFLLVRMAREDPGMVFLPAIVLVLFVILTVLFAGLVVELTPARLRVWFGPGWIRREFPVENIRSCRAVRNRWYYGWGVRLTPHGWMFNIWGLDAVEILLHDGRRFRIGTDEPEALRKAIQARIPGD